MKKIGNVLGSALNANLIESTVNANLIGRALRDRMTLTEAVEIINEMEAYVNIALRCLQKQKFQLAFEVGRRPIFDELENYKAAVSLLIESDKTALLEQRCRKIYELACEAEPLVKQAISAISNCKKIGETEAKGSVWASHIKAYWEAVVLPLLQTDAEAVVSPTQQTKAEAPHRGRPKDVSISWLVENPDGHLEVIHDLADGKREKKFYKVIKAAILENWFERPPYNALIKEFGDIGSKGNYHNYMNNQYNETELEQLRETLRLRCQNL